MRLRDSRRCLFLPEPASKELSLRSWRRRVRLVRRICNSNELFGQETTRVESAPRIQIEAESSCRESVSCIPAGENKSRQGLNASRVPSQRPHHYPCGSHCRDPQGGWMHAATCSPTSWCSSIGSIGTSRKKKKHPPGCLPAERRLLSKEKNRSIVRGAENVND